MICALIVLAFAVFADGAGDDTTTIAYVQLYGLMAFMGVVLILFIQALVSVAIWNYFRTTTRASTACGTTRSPRRSR